MASLEGVAKPNTESPNESFPVSASSIASSVEGPLKLPRSLEMNARTPIRGINQDNAIHRIT